MKRISVGRRFCYFAVINSDAQLAKSRHRRSLLWMALANEPHWIPRIPRIPLVSVPPKPPNSPPPANRPAALASFHIRSAPTLHCTAAGKKLWRRASDEDVAPLAHQFAIMKGCLASRSSKGSNSSSNSSPVARRMGNSLFNPKKSERLMRSQH